MRGYINRAIDQFLLELVRRRGITLASEDTCYTGTIVWHEVPFEDEAEYRLWWLPQTTMEHGRRKILCPARMSPREKSRYAVHEDHNILTTLGREEILLYMSSPTGNTPPFAQYFAIGTAPINSVDPGDTAVQGEIYRAMPSATTQTGTQVDIATFIPQGSAQAAFTNVGLFGVNANPGVNGGGVLMTHALSNYTKGNIALVSDYIMNLQ